MVLLYLLFALTVSTVLTAIFAGQAAQHQQGRAFLFFFILLLVIAGACDVWLVPVVAAGRGTIFSPVALLIVFGAVLSASVLLSVRSQHLMAQTAGHRDAVDAEAAVFDSLIWLAMLIFGIAVLKAVAI